MPVVVGKGALAVLAMLSMLMFSLTGITLDEMIQTNDKVNPYDIEEIKDEITDLVDDYVEFSRRYLPEWLEENPDFRKHKPTEEDLRDFKGDALDQYIYQEEYTDLEISENALDYMESEIPEEDRWSIDHARKHEKNKVEEYIVETYLRYLINKD